MYHSLQCNSTYQQYTSQLYNQKRIPLTNKHETSRGNHQDVNWNCSCFQTKVNEETRLAVTVHHIDEEVSVVPRGAFVMDPHGLVQINRSFCGTYVLVFYEAWLKYSIIVN